MAQQDEEKVPYWKQLLSVWKSLVVVLAPLVFLPLPLSNPTPAAKCAYIILIMASYWMTEAIPIAATALLPVATMPWLGVIGSKQLCKNYLKDTNMLFVGGLLVAVAVERWNLHKRMALRVLMLVGSKPKWLMLGFMVTTAFLSMWLSNTATTAMMIPIVHAVLMELNSHRLSQRANHNKAHDNDDITKSTPLEMETSLNGPAKDSSSLKKVPLDNNNEDDDDDDNAEEGSLNMYPETQSTNKYLDDPNLTKEQAEEYLKDDQTFAELCKGMTLSVAYAANVGGTATLTGTGPNLILKGQTDTLYNGQAGVNFSSWFILAFPNAILLLIMAWTWLQLLFLGPKQLFGLCFKQKYDDSDSANAVIRREYKRLGPWSFAEISTLCFFILLAVMWLTREPEFVPGWSDLFIRGYVTDASVSITIGVLLFMWPSERPNVLCFRKKDNESKPGPVPALLDWPLVHQKLPWNVILILGGGFALAEASKHSGLSAVIGQAFLGFGDFPPWLLVLLLCTITAIFTEVASNTATATIFLPILAELAVAINIHPLYLMMPVTIATSLAFMLPVATPPNAIVFAYGHMKIIDMVKAGALMNVLGILSITICINSWGYYQYGLGSVPDWALTDVVKAVTNATMLPELTTVP